MKKLATYITHFTKAKSEKLRIKAHNNAMCELTGISKESYLNNIKDWCEYHNIPFNY